MVTYRGYFAVNQGLERVKTANYAKNGQGMTMICTYKRQGYLLLGPWGGTPSWRGGVDALESRIGG